MFAFVWFMANITMAKSRKTNKGKHHNGQKPESKERQTSQWPKAVNQRKANITMTHCNVCLCLVYGFWPL
jgi:hypothetical protein